ncbi:hypothetical protein F0562_004247 [Nyssa sinensis]|uniref:DDT domain-containing protein n=1 Tax=Nyssa sinensis TaxID=561372 RepID=A0A5J5BY01_9ASTE|nr:hypothetical protein F0562_004247 [Nyssa sinensis]
MSEKSPTMFGLCTFNCPNHHKNSLQQWRLLRAPASKQSASSNNKNEKKSRKQTENGCPSPAKRTKCPGVRVVGGRIYDSENGKTCHQCRQKTMDFVAACRNPKKNKQCTINFCHKCLWNRYGEKAEEMSMLEDWKCPKCRGICNCSFCMKKRGHQPTGMLVHTAKATGFSSVSEMLQFGGSDNLGHEKSVKDMGVSPKNLAVSNKESVVVSPRKRGKENSLEGKGDSNLHPPPLAPNPDEKKSKKMRQERLKEIYDGNRDDGVLLKDTNPKKPQISTGISNKEVKTNGMIDCVRQGERNSKKMSSPSDPSRKERRKEKRRLLKETNPKRAQNPNGISKKEVKTNGKVDGALQYENNSKTMVSKEVSTDSSRDEKTKEERDSSSHKVGEVLDSKKIDNDGGQLKRDVESRKVKRNAIEFQCTDLDVDIPLAKGTELTTVVGIDLQPEDAGHALQFLEFCAAFGEILHLKKGQPESVLRDLLCGRTGRQGKYSLTVQFYIQLLSLIQKDLGEEPPRFSPTNGKNSWLHALKKCLSKSQCVVKKLPLDGGADGYHGFDNSKKLILLNFLCDEVLGTVGIRNWIDDQNSKFVENTKEAKGRVLAAKDKEKHLKQKMQDEVAKAILARNGAPLTISEHDAIVSQIKTETAQAHSEMLELKGMIPKKKHRSDAVRTEPMLLGINGCAYWRLKGYSKSSDESDILLQDMGTCDPVASSEKWFVFDFEQKKVIEKHIHSISERRLRSQKTLDGLPSKGSGMIP